MLSLVSTLNKFLNFGGGESQGSPTYEVKSKQDKF